MKAAQPSRRMFHVVKGHTIGGQSTAAVIYTPSDKEEVLDPQFAAKLLVGIANDIWNIGEVRLERPRRGTKTVRSFGIAMIIFAKGVDALGAIKAVRRSLTRNFQKINPGFMADKQRQRARRQATRTLVANELAELQRPSSTRGNPAWMTPSFVAAGHFANR